jgi:sulfatase modifying factor 1
MKRWFVVMGVLVACGSGERFTEQELAAEEIPDDPGRWTLEDNRPAMLRVEPGEQVQAFELARTEVNQGIYRAIVGRNPSLSVGYDKKKMVGEKLPVQGVSFLDALRFCNAWSEAEGLEPAYDLDGPAPVWNPRAGGYRLPTEAEWQHAAAAGRPVLWVEAVQPEEACRYANLADQALGATGGFPCSDGHASKAPVASLEPNAWGLYDMSGNVWEWVWTEPSDAGERVYKGGSWLDGPEASRITARRHGDPSELSIQLGFRVARSLPE